MTVRRAVPALVITVLVAVALGSVAVTLVGLHRDPAPVVVTDPPPVAAATARGGRRRGPGRLGRRRGPRPGPRRRTPPAVALHAPGRSRADRDAAHAPAAGWTAAWSSATCAPRCSRCARCAVPATDGCSVVDRVVGGTADDVALPVDSPSARTWSCAASTVSGGWSRRQGGLDAAEGQPASGSTRWVPDPSTSRQRPCGVRQR